jgi:hypothetical protein
MPECADDAASCVCGPSGIELDRRSVSTFTLRDRSQR